MSKKENIFNLLKNFYNDNNRMDTTFKYQCNYKVLNKFFRSNTPYKHIFFLINLINKVLNNEMNDFAYDNKDNNIRRKYVKKILYKEGNKENYIKALFSFDKFNNKKDEIYLLETDACSKNDRTIFDIKKRFNRIKNNISFEKDFSLKYYGNIKENIYIDIKKNCYQKEKKYYIYHLIIYNKTDKRFCISDPFSSIGFKQFSKRCNCSFIGNKYIKKEKDISYYCHNIYDIDNDRFRDEFLFKLNFFTRYNYRL